MSKARTVKLNSRTAVLDETEGYSTRALVVLVALGLVIVAGLVACGSGSSQPTQASPSLTVPAAETPALDGATLLDTRCSSCHSADRAKQAKKTPEQWDQTVTRMIGQGAQLTEAEKRVLVDYLAETYGP
jgi:cytochrome c5